MELALYHALLPGVANLDLVDQFVLHNAFTDHSLRRQSVGRGRTYLVCFSVFGQGDNRGRELYFVNFFD
jgi:hypothetical protein